MNYEIPDAPTLKKRMGLLTQEEVIKAVGTTVNIFRYHVKMGWIKDATHTIGRQKRLLYNAEDLIEIKKYFEKKEVK